MSMFLPENSSLSGPAQPGATQITPTNPETTSEDVKLMQRVFTAAMQNPNLIPDQFMSYVLDWIQTQRLIIPIGQVFGFTQYTAKEAPPITTEESTTSTTYVDLTTPGPKLDGLSDGSYLIFFGANAQNSSAGSGSRMSISVNGATPADSDEARTESANKSGIARAIAKTLNAGGSNSIKAQYRVGNGATTGTWGDRWMIALKYAN